MDTSKEYIKMCEKAEKIQKARPVFYVGNTYTYYETGWGFLIYGRHTGVFYKTIDDRGALTDMPNSSAVYLKNGIDLKKVLTWLPRQDQLQEMIDLSWRLQLIRIVNFMDDKDYYKLHQRSMMDIFTSMEQLWLAFVMKEKYQKTWNGENWTCIEK